MAKSRTRITRKQRIFLCTISLLSVTLLMLLYYLSLKSAYKSLLNYNQTMLLKSKYNEEDVMNDSERTSKEELQSTNKIINKIIILWTPFFGENDYVLPLEKNNCKINNCIFTSNKSLLSQSDAVLFHLRDLNIKELPKERNKNQRWILLHHESPQHTPNILWHLENLINWTVTYRKESDISLSPVFKRRTSFNDYNSDVNYALNKTRMIVWLASNCKTPSNREEYVEQLRKTVTIDVYGQCGDRQCLPKMSPKCWETLSKEYRFILAFENSICRDYVTEKYFGVLKYNFIPIVFGGADYAQFAPLKSYIDALSFKSPRQLAKYLIHLSKNPEKYNEYFEWRNEYDLNYNHYSCEICRKLNNPHEPHKFWSNLNTWWFNEGNCKSWENSQF